MKFVPVLLAVALSAAFAAPACAAGAADSITAVDPHVRMVPPGQPTTGAFFVLKNADDKDHKVVKVESAAAQVTEMHNHVNEGGMMKMRPIKDIEIKAKGETALKPGSLHVMLIDLKQPLKEGDSVALKLTFEDDSSKEITVPVRKIQPPMPMQMPGGMNHDHKNMH